MKIRITYDPENRAERIAAHLIGTEAKKVMRMLLKAPRVKESKGDPFSYIYITSGSPRQSITRTALTDRKDVSA